MNKSKWLCSCVVVVSMGTLVLHMGCNSRTSSQAAAPIDPGKTMELIGTAIRQYADVNKTFPPAYTTDKDGKPLLSWRVLILPFLDPDGGLYEQFHLDEPWDSENNKNFITQMPSLYRHRESKVAAEGRTNFLTVRGANTLFPGKAGIALTDLGRAPSNIVMLVEVSDARAVIWTKPDDFEYSEKSPMDGLIGFRPYGFLAGLADGSVGFFDTRSIKAADVRVLFTRNSTGPER